MNTPYSIFSEEEIRSHTALEVNAMTAARQEEFRLKSAVFCTDHSELRSRENEDRCSNSK
jgi:hypothetical protein